MDLHTHTTASDGKESPSSVVKLAKEAGLHAVAITDHDTVGGIAEAISEGKKQGIEVIPGIEISTAARGHEFHILGYFMDWKNEQFLTRISNLRQTRQKRNEKIIQNLSSLGMDISLDEIRKLVNKEGETQDSVGRPHIADMLVKKGIVANLREAFDLYLSKDGKAYAQIERIHPATALDWIKEAGGAAVIAHPGLYDADEMVERFIRYGVDGLEVYHSDHTSEDEVKYKKMAKQHHLIMTAGSDFHGTRQGEVFHGPLGGKTVSYDVVTALKQAAKQC